MERFDPASDGPDWALVLGPGTELERVVSLLEALGETTLAAPLEIEALEDLAELGEERLVHGRLVLHAETLPLEDLGLVRRFLDAEPGWELVLVGLDPSATVARRLLRRPDARWFAEPLDVDQLGDLIAPPTSREAWGIAEPRGDDPPPFDAPPTGDPLAAALGVSLDEEELAALREPEDFDQRDDLDPADEPRPPGGYDAPSTAPRYDSPSYDSPSHDSPRHDSRRSAPRSADAGPTSGFDHEIERILAQPPDPPLEGGTRAARASEDLPPERSRAATAVLDPGGADAGGSVGAGSAGAGSAEAGSAEAGRGGRASAAGGSAAGATSPAPYFKDQVADLADIALRIELSLEMARERALAEGDGPALEDLELEVQRLAQFTRTLSYLSSPPAPGRTRVRLADMLEEMLAQAGADEHSPRYLWRADGELPVRCDKTLLHSALEAVLYLVHHGAGPAGTVRAEGRERPGRENVESCVELTLRFPPGRLEGLAPEQAVVPYALRTVLPELGPNALAAAAGILRGQGGRLELSDTGGEWLWRLRLPSA